MYVAVSPPTNVPSPDCSLAPEKNGPLLSDKLFPSPSVSVSISMMSLRVEFPLFSTDIVYSTISPAPILLSPLSVTFAVLVTSKPTFDTVNISV